MILRGRVLNATAQRMLRGCSRKRMEYNYVWNRRCCQCNSRKPTDL